MTIAQEHNFIQYCVSLKVGKVKYIFCHNNNTKLQKLAAKFYGKNKINHFTLITQQIVESNKQ